VQQDKVEAFLADKINHLFHFGLFCGVPIGCGERFKKKIEELF